MKLCSRCKQEITVDKYFTKKSTCPKCGGDLHTCVNCKFFSETAHNKCLEPKAEFQRSRDRANFCDYFIFREGGASSSAQSREDAMKKLNDLFRK